MATIVSVIKAAARRLRCALLGGHDRVALIDDTTAIVVCRRCLARTEVPVLRVPAATPAPEPTLAAAYDLVAALATDDPHAAAAALGMTSILHVAIAACVLGESGPPVADLRRHLEQLALAAEIDSIDVGDLP